MKIKRWILLTLVGLLAAIAGLSLLNRASPINVHAAGDAFFRWLERNLGVEVPTGDMIRVPAYGVISAGVLLFLVSLSKMWSSVSSYMTPGATPGQLVQSVYKRGLLDRGPKILVIGGGTGLGTMLRGLKQHSSNLTAVVTVADDGGSSGKLLKQLNILPPGDIRNCIAALADSETTMTELLQYRFRGEGTGEGLRDHAFGNLLIAAMSGISEGDFEEAIRKTSQVLNIRGRVLPCTQDKVTLRAEMEDGSIVIGETNIAHSPLKIKRVFLDPPDAKLGSEVVGAISEAEVIVIGPGSVYTSVLPNLLVPGVAEAIQQSKAVKVYICNVMTQPGETDGFTAADHVRAIEAHLPRRIFRHVLYNTGVPTAELAKKYEAYGAVRVEPDPDRIRDMGYRPIGADFMNQTDVVRHDATKLSEAILKLLR
jgi:uncharacterized cofD-like protein